MRDINEIGLHVYKLFSATVRLLLPYTGQKIGSPVNKIAYVDNFHYLKKTVEDKTA